MRPLNFFHHFKYQVLIFLRVKVNMTSKDIFSEKEEKVNSERKW